MNDIFLKCAMSILFATVSIAASQAFPALQGYSA